MKVYQLHADTENHACFLQSRDNGEERVRALAFQQRWEPFPEPLPKITFKLHRNDSAKQNYEFDISTMTGGLIVLSTFTTEGMREILAPRGQFLPIKTDSKRKEYIGYYPTCPVQDCLDLKRSKYTQYEHGKVIQRYALIKEKISDDWLFVIGGGDLIFVTDRFRDKTEEMGLKGFSWRQEVEVT